MLGGFALLNESTEADGMSDAQYGAAHDDLPETSIEAPAETPDVQERDTVRVAIVKTANREKGFARAVALLGEMDFSGRNVYLKGSYNSPDPFPATTHPDALGAIVRTLRGKGARGVTLIERSGMGRTRDVLEELHVPAALEELDVSFRPLDELSAGEWLHFELAGSHWPKGIAFPRFLTRDKCIVQLCNLKTHRFGGEFSASLKNSIGLIARYAAAESGFAEKDAKRPGRRWNYMKDLHSSPDQGLMIAEVNYVYAPELIVMDAVEVFITGGPEKGETAAPEIIAASRDRVALDAVGFAILQYAGARIGGSARVFEQAQIRRAAELKLGVDSPEKIRVVSDDDTGRLLASRLESILL
uniref:Iron-sulfur cluster-binding protein n=1 Tax=uncultured bacterium contig00009 TaxID=1181501 RepID=A0A806KIE0_9BACT|nr:iron-sulfur cluster-binding protein [uncultured bacterium contig00009]